MNDALCERVVIKLSDAIDLRIFVILWQNNKELSDVLHLRDPSFYRYLNASGNVQIDISSESRRFEALRLAFTVLQIPQPMVDGIFRVLSAILWLGNLNFEDVDGERCELATEDKQIIAIVAELMGLQENDVKHVALMRQINVRGNITEIPLKVQEVIIPIKKIFVIECA